MALTSFRIVAVSTVMILWLFYPSVTRACVDLVYCVQVSETEWRFGADLEVGVACSFVCRLR